MNTQPSYNQLLELYKEVARLTSNHEVRGGLAVVFPRDLGLALDKVNPDWWKDATR